MDRLPAGTVTFLFTDIEGSTSMVQELGDRFREVLEDHNRLLRSAFGAGIAVRMEGDAFFVAFASARDAVNAAVAGQRALATHRWPGGVRPRVRMGLHTGEGVLGGADYVGIDVHRAARLSAAGHGDQILVSEATWAAVAPTDGLAARSIGSHWFKDLDEPIQVHQIIAEGLLRDFPPIRSIGTPPNDLPSPTSGFIGRSAEIGDLLELLEPSRLVTLTGPGGVGKTRLALDVASRALHRFSDGVFFVPLETLTDPDLVIGAIAEHVGLGLESEPDPLAGLTAHLSDRELLLVLDNFEQVTQAAEIVAHVRAGAPRLTILVTSQQVLRVAGETVYPVQPLDLPRPGDVDLGDLLQSDAAVLFLERARATGMSTELSPEDVEVVAQIVTELDGLPLALELAAARIGVFGLEGLHARIGERFQTVRGGTREAPDRHRTLEAAIAWSHDLLDEAERKAFADLSVALGGFTLETAEAILDPDLSSEAADLVESLLHKSLLRRSPHGGPVRFSMLRSIREYAQRQATASGRADSATRRLADSLVELAREASPRLESEGQSEWLDRLAAEHDNIRSVIEWSRAGGDVDLALELAGSIWRFHHRRGHLPEARRNLEALLALPGASQRPRAIALTGLASIVYWTGEFERSVDLYREAVELFEPLGEKERVAFCFYGMSTATTLIGDIDTALDYADRAEAAYAACGLDDGVRRVVPAVAFATWMAGHLEVAAEQWERAAKMFHEAGDIAEELQTCVARAIVDYQLGRSGIPERVRGCIEAMVAYGDVTGTLMALEFFARVIVSHVPETAVRIADGARRLRATMGGGHTPETVGLASTWEEAALLLGADRMSQLSEQADTLDVSALVELARAVELAPEDAASDTT